MNTKSDARKLAREYYLTTEMTQAEIAVKCKVGAKAVSEWAKLEGWKMQKAATNITPRKTIAGLMLQLEALRVSISERGAGKNFPDSKESDIIMKVSKSIKMLQKTLTLSDYIFAFEELQKFAGHVAPEKVADLFPILDEFIQIKAKETTEA